MTFTDLNGDEWKLRLTVGTLADLRRDAGLDLSRALRSADALAEVLFGDPENLAKALWVLCETQARERNLSPEDFAHRFDGPTIERATEALLAAVADFFPRTRVGQELRENQKKLLEAMDKTLVNGVRERVEKATISLRTSSDSADTSGSIPAH